MNQAKFGEIRALMQREPTPNLWIDLCLWLRTTLQQSPDWCNEQVLPYVKNHLDSRWPDDLRKIPYLVFQAHCDDLANPSNLAILNLCKHAICLTWGKLNEQNIKALCSIKDMALTHLDIKWNFLGDVAITPLWSSMPSLTSLNLAQNQLNNASIEQLSLAPYYKNLTHLELWGNKLTQESLHHIVDQTDGALETLSIWKIGNVGCQAIAASDRFPKLKRLDLSWTRPGAETLLCFGDRARFPSLERLELIGVKQTHQIETAIDKIKSQGIDVKY